MRLILLEVPLLGAPQKRLTPLAYSSRHFPLKRRGEHWIVSVRPGVVITRGG